MIYIEDSDYRDLFTVNFKDDSELWWRIDIQGETTGYVEAVELTGAAEPIEWMGVGTGDQTKVVLGSTGTLRLVVTADTVGYFSYGERMLYPQNINERRVLVWRKFSQNGDWFLYWQGFIKPEQYTQDWKSTPYEMEFPIVSVLASMEYFILPENLSDNPTSSITQPTNVADLVRWILRKSGGKFYRIYTNKPVYEDWTGNTQQYNNTDVHWTQGKAYLSNYIYGGAETFKDVLEELFYPHGKLYDIGGNMYAMLYCKYTPGQALYELVLDSPTLRFSEVTGWPPIVVRMNEINLAGTDNNFSIIAKPNKVEFELNQTTQTEIFELKKDFISYAVPTEDNGSSNVTTIEVENSSGTVINRRIYSIPPYNSDFQWNIKSPGAKITWQAPEGSLPTVEYVSVLDSTYSSDTEKYTHSPILPVAARLYYNNTITIEPLRPLQTRVGIDRIKISLKVYSLNGKDPINGDFSSASTDHSLYIGVYDVTANLYFDWGLSTYWWSPIQAGITTMFQVSSHLNFEANECSMEIPVSPFNSSNVEIDSPRYFRISLHHSADNTTPVPFLVHAKIEYVKDNYVETTSSRLAYFAENMKSNIGVVQEIGGSGDDVSITFKTMGGQKNQRNIGGALITYNSFCDAQKYIDTEDRKKIEINAAKFQLYTKTGFNGEFDFVHNFVSVLDGQETYIPVAVGMNARRNTVRLTLVSTNISTTQPT